MNVPRVCTNFGIGPLVLALILASASLAAAAPAPRIPPNALAGRERDQFLDKFPQRERAGPVINFQNEARPTKRRTCRVKGARKAC